MPEKRTIYRGIALALVTIALAACARAGGVDVVRVQRDDIEVLPTPTPLQIYTHPITGVEYPGTQGWQSRRALAVKVENSRMARPQAGLDEADLVYEELVEGGITRFVVVFQSQDAERVGPVRSARHIDPDIVAPLGPLFGYSGAVPPVVQALRSVAAITDVGVDMAPGAYYRDRGRQSPHNLYTSTSALWRGRGGEPPAPLFSFLPSGADASEGGEPASAVSFTFAARSELTRWTYDDDAGLWRRFHVNAPHTVETGEHIGARNVLIQKVTPGGGGSFQVLGEGEAILFRGGRVLHGRWIRSSFNEPTQFVGADGDALLLAPGATWVELLPAGQSVSIG